MSPESLFAVSSSIQIPIATPTLHQADGRSQYIYTNREEHSANISWYSHTLLCSSFCQYN